jgi:hypothetical protein
MSETQTHAIGEKNPGGGLAQWLGLGGAAVAVAVIIALVVSWPDHEDPAASLERTSAPGEAAAAKPAPRPPCRLAAARPIRFCSPP